MMLSEFDHTLPEPVHIAILVDQIPVKPIDVIVLAVGVVVASLRTPHFIAGYKHGHPARKQKEGCKVLNLASAQRFDSGIGGFALHPAVPTQVVIDPIPVVFAVGLIMLGVI